MSQQRSVIFRHIFTVLVLIALERLGEFQLLGVFGQIKDIFFLDYNAFRHAFGFALAPFFGGPRAIVACNHFLDRSENLIDRRFTGLVHRITFFGS